MGFIGDIARRIFSPVNVRPPPPPPATTPTTPATPQPVHRDEFHPVPVMSGPLQQPNIHMHSGKFGNNPMVREGAPIVHVNSASGPISQAEWNDPSRLVARLTQNPATGVSGQHGDACGASNLLGSALMASPEHAARLIGNIANDNSTRLTTAERTELGAISQKVHNHTATFEDLNRAQELMYRAGNTTTGVDQAVTDALALNSLPADHQAELTRLQGQPTWSAADRTRIGELLTEATGSTTRVVPDGPNGWRATVEGGRTSSDHSGFSDDEELRLGQMGGMTNISSNAVGADSLFSQEAAKLKPGEAMTFRVYGDKRDVDNGSTGSADHFVTVGRRTDGTWYLYNPDPGPGDSTLVVGERGRTMSAQFQAAVRQYDSRQPFDQNGNMPNVTRYSHE